MAEAFYRLNLLLWLVNERSSKMALSKTIVAVVVDQEFGSRLWELAHHVPVWVCNSEANGPVIQELWELSRLSPNQTAVTSFSRPNSAPEQVFMDNLETIDLHHPSWLVLEVYGTSRSVEITAALQQYGVIEFQDNPIGFKAMRQDQPIT